MRNHNKTMEKIQDKKEENLTQDLSNHLNHPQPKVLAYAVFISLVMGIVGGALGSAYVLKNPSAAERLGIFKEGQAPQAQKALTILEDSSVTNVVKEASPAVVSVIVSKDLSLLPEFRANPFFPFFGFSENPSTKQPNVQKVGAGSGFFVSEDGLILTNKHVVSDPSASYTVITQDGKEYAAKVMAIDQRNDLAIVKIEAKNLPFLKFADSSQIQVGEKAIAIGNSLGQYQNTVTAGVISGVGRSITAGSYDGSEELEGVLQTDAAINPGNSGGPLLNSLGQVMGINTAVDMEGQSVGFAIPSNDAQKALDSFRRTGKIKRPFIGVRYIMISENFAKEENLPKDYGALLVRGETTTDFAVTPGSPADKAGLTENDIILEVDGKKLDKDYSLATALKVKEAGDQVSLLVYSKGAEKNVKLTLGETE